MPPSHVFISHATEDDDFVKELRLALESHPLTVWVDSRRMSGGDKLDPVIDKAIEEARQFIAVLSPTTVNSAWVRKEIQKALEVEKQRKDEGYKVIPLLLPGLKTSALGNWFDEEPLAVPVELKTGGVSEAMPAILAALGERLPTDHETQQTTATHPVEELILELSDPKSRLSKVKLHVTATARLIYDPADPARRKVESKRFKFTAPLDPIEADDLRWYLEDYFRWPIGFFKERADFIEKQLPVWGQSLYNAAMANKSARESLNAWQSSTDSADRCFSVYVESDLPEGASEKKQIAAREAASFLLSLPWELLHDDGGYLFQGKRAVRVRRRLPNRRRQDVIASGLPIRILLVSPRPEDDSTGYIDHRISAKPLIEAIESLGELATLTLLTPPTFPDLQKALKRADEAGEPFDVVHFDGHGVYDKTVGLGALCFEDPKDANKIEKRASELIHAEKMAEVMRDYRVPLVFLEACQSAMTEEDPTASVAARLLEEGVASVVAMSHSVLVETARRFVKAFYEELARGARVGAAMIAGQRALYGDTYRIKIMGAGELRLQDWFVPVLYQEELDPQLITRLQPEAVRQLHEKQRRLRLGHLPEPPSHNFQGRSRELLSLERLLNDQNYAVVRGQGGAGKTTLAAELARWLVRVGRFRRAAFVTLEYFSDVRGLIDSLGKQLLLEGDGWSVATFGDDLKKALQPIERALSDQSTIMVFDNLESILPDASGQAPIAAAPYEEVFDLCGTLLEASAATRILFTSRESLPAPFDNKRREVVLGALSKEDAIELVSQVMAEEGLKPKSEDPGSDPQEVVDLVEAVNRHARALVLLAREVSRKGVGATTENLHKLMEDLHRRYPDDRENSLYASVELSLRRLSPEMREQVKALSVFHGGAHGFVLAHVLGVEKETVDKLGAALIETGLAEDMGYGHLRLDPALPSYMSKEIGEEDQEELMARWAEGMRALIILLYEQKSMDTKIAYYLVRLELLNLMALLAAILSTKVIRFEGDSWKPCVGIKLPST